MNIYKKIMLALGIAFITIPQISNALDVKGDALANSLKITYGTSISPSNLSNPNANFAKWNDFIHSTLYPYVIENSSIAGIKDTLLMNALNLLSTSSTNLTGQLTTVRGGIISKEEKQIYTPILIRCIADLNSIKNAINTATSKLRVEKYYIASKKNAQEILLMALDRVQQTAEKSIELLTAEVQKRGK